MSPAPRATAGHRGELVQEHGERDPPGTPPGRSAPCQTDKREGATPRSCPRGRSGGQAQCHGPHRRNTPRCRQALPRTRRARCLFSGPRRSRTLLGREGARRPPPRLRRALPAPSVYEGRETAAPGWPIGPTAPEGRRETPSGIRGATNRELAAEELLLLRLANEKPAPFAPFRSSSTRRSSPSPARPEAEAYEEAIGVLGTSFASMPKFGPDNQDLLTMLPQTGRRRALFPARAARLHP